MARNPVVPCLVLFTLLLATPDPSDAGPRIVALGGSLAAGYGLEQGNGLAPRLQPWLDAPGVEP